MRVREGQRRAVPGRGLYPRLDGDWLLIADRNYYNWQDWCTAADTGAALLWRVKADLRLDPLEFYPDGSYRSVLVNPNVKSGARRQEIIDAARAGQDLDPQEARYVRVIEYEVPDREGDGKDEIIALVTTILDFPDAPPGNPRPRLPRKMGARDREPAAQDLPARPRKILGPNHRTW